MSISTEQSTLESSNRESAVRIVISGVPYSLYYALTPELAYIQCGALVRVELGRRAAMGWVVEKLPLSEAQERVRALETESRDMDSDQLDLLPMSSEFAGRSPRLKPILSALEAFPPSLMQLFEWVSQYYGAPLADVIDVAVPLSPSVIKGLADAGSKKRARGPRKKEDVSAALRHHSAKPENLTADQERAIEELRGQLTGENFAPYLLFGVTGSGKTEVYLRLIEEVLAKGGSALVIVPEIALTPQLFDQFFNRLQHPIGLLHSELTPAERWQTWEAIRTGQIRVVIGARSAVFAPLENPSLIVVDEEHESSYKQSDGLRYHARDVAVMRAKYSQCPILLGSATPSFETLYNVLRKRYRMLELPTRVTTRPPPQVEVIDLREFRRRDMPSENISPPLHALLIDTLEKKEQAIILYNRRGFSSYLQCKSCNEVLICPNCSVTLTYHKKRDIALCHYCDYTVRTPRQCPLCHDPRTMRIESAEPDAEYGTLIQCGGGTERVVEELATLFPTATLAQMDRDTVTKKESYREILSTMRTGHADILVGTQMVAKGHDLPNVTLVGIINADLGLHLPDFRAAEKAFQLITQVAGRAGRRSEPGRVLLQTHEPNHPTIVATALGKFRAFARFELDNRKRLGYPPFTKLLRIVVSAPALIEARSGAENVRAAVEALLAEIAAASEPVTEGVPAPQILGPAAAPQERLRGRYRYHLLVKAHSVKVLSQLAAAVLKWRENEKRFPNLRVTCDVDPVDML